MRIKKWYKAICSLAKPACPRGADAIPEKPNFQEKNGIMLNQNFILIPHSPLPPSGPPGNNSCS